MPKTKDAASQAIVAGRHSAVDKRASYPGPHKGIETEMNTAWGVLLGQLEPFSAALPAMRLIRSMAQYCHLEQ
jgi:hypothetical protein